MPRVLGIDPGTISLDICGLEDGRVFLDRSIPTTEALGDPQGVARVLESVGPVDLVAGPSGYGLPLVDARQLTEDDVRLACLSAAGEPGGIGGLSEVMRALARTNVPTVFTPGAIHLPSVPVHRKINRIDVGTADKVCAAALAIHEEAVRHDCAPSAISLILLELGGAFSAALAVEHGRIVDGMGGSSGPIGMRGVGSLDGEVAFLAGHVSKDMLFHGGVEDIPGDAGRVAFVEGALKAVAAMRVSAPSARRVLLSGRMAIEPWVQEPLRRALGDVRVVEGFSSSAKHAAQGAALIAEGLAGGESRVLVDTLGLREARGTVLDYLHVIDRDTAARRIGVTLSR
jgi:predicted butyrate kinase (DUF1464 family)